MKEQVKFNEKDGNGNTVEVVREVPTTKCDVNSNDLKKSFPETQVKLDAK